YLLQHVAQHRYLIQQAGHGFQIATAQTTQQTFQIQRQAAVTTDITVEDTADDVTQNRDLAGQITQHAQVFQQAGERIGTVARKRQATFQQTAQQVAQNRNTADGIGDRAQAFTDIQQAGQLVLTVFTVAAQANHG